MTPWTTVRLHLRGARGRRAPLRISAADPSPMLREWAEGSRVHVERVTDADGRELTPREVDWTGHPDGAPKLRAGRPETGRGRDARRIELRVTDDEYEALQTAAGGPPGAWLREIGLREARRKAG